MNIGLDLLVVITLLLLICSVVVVVLILERIWFYWRMDRLVFDRADSPSMMIRQGRWRMVRDHNYGREDVVAKGVMMLMDVHQDSRSKRAEAVCIWLGEQRQRLLAPLKLLTWLAVAGALLAALSAVVGGAHAGIGISQNNTSTGYSLILSVLQTKPFDQSLWVTALGLTTATFALAFFNAFRYWVNRFIGKLDSILAEMNAEMSRSTGGFSHALVTNQNHSKLLANARQFSSWELSH